MEHSVARKIMVNIDEPSQNLFHMGEVRLCVAVLMSAVEDYLNPKRMGKHGGKGKREDALEWFTKPVHSHVFSFPAVCETLNLDCHAVWRELQNHERGNE